MFNWEDLNLPEVDSVEDAKKRLDAIHAKELQLKGIAVKVDAGSPGLNPSTAQSREISVMAALGLSVKEISLVTNIDEKVLKVYYNRELNVSKMVANVVVARKALEMAVSGRFPEMTKFWLKSQAKWKDTSTLELTGRDGGPVEINTARDKLSRAMGLDPESD